MHKSFLILAFIKLNPRNIYLKIYNIEQIPQSVCYVIIVSLIVRGIAVLFHIYIFYYKKKLECKETMKHFLIDISSRLLQ